MKFLLQNATTPDQLTLVFKCLSSDLIDKTVLVYAEKGGHFSVVLEEILSRHVQKFNDSKEEDIDMSLMWDNLLTLLR